MNWLGYVVPLLLWTCCTAEVDVCNRAPPEIDFGQSVSGEGVIGRSEVKYECNPGYVMEGSETVKCTAQTWGPLPKCLAPCIITSKQLDEKHLTLHPYGERSHVFKHNSAVEFRCKERNRRISTLPKTCVDGHIDLPSCDSECHHQVPEIDFGRVESMGGVPGRITAKFECSPGYVMEGSESVDCSLKVWEPLPKCLAPCIITREELNANLIRFPFGQSHSQLLQHNTTVEFVCEEKYVLVRQLKATCVDGHIDLPLCYEETDYSSFGRLPTSILEHLKEEGKGSADD